MEKEKLKGIIESILFASGRVVKAEELSSLLELDKKKLSELIEEIKNDYKKDSRGLSIIEVEDGYQLATKKDYFEFLYPIFDKRIKPKLSAQALEVLTIIAYNQRITRSEIDEIRGVDSSGPMNKLLEYNLIDQAGKSDLPRKTNVLHYY